MLAVIILCTTHTQPVHVLQMWQTTLRAQHEHNVVLRPYICLPQQWVNSNRSTPLGSTPSIFFTSIRNHYHIFSPFFFISYSYLSLFQRIGALRMLSPCCCCCPRLQLYLCVSVLLLFLVIGLVAALHFGLILQ